MAYGAVTVTRIGDNDYQVTFSGTALSSTTEATISKLPQKGRIRRIKAAATSGTGTTVDPILGTSANPADTTVVFENATAAATVDVQPGAYYYASAGVLYYRGRHDAGSDNSESVELLISGGWDS
jgi:hypothetical protein